MIDVLNLLIGPIVLLLCGVLLVGVFKRIAGDDPRTKQAGTTLMLWGGGGILLLVIMIAIANVFLAPSAPVTDLPPPTLRD
jgi:hypothetical protein